MLKGICHICGAAADLETCWKCGRRVCKKHLDRTSGLCSVCKTGIGSARPTGGKEFTIPRSARPTTIKPGAVKR